MATRLTEEERAALPTTLPHWSLAEGRDALRRDFQFRDFTEAWGFLSSVALLAEKHDHHPEWSNIWNCVLIELSSHDAGGVTQKDIAMAIAIDKLLA